MANTYSFRLVTPLGSLIDSEQVESITAPGVNGRLGVYAQHAPMVCALGAGMVSATEAGKTRYFAIAGGTLQVKRREVVLLADHAEEADSADAASALASPELGEVADTD